MSDYLMRDDAPLTGEEWKRLDKLVVSAARRMLVGRRFRILESLALRIKQPGAICVLK